MQATQSIIYTLFFSYLLVSNCFAASVTSSSTSRTSSSFGTGTGSSTGISGNTGTSTNTGISGSTSTGTSGSGSGSTSTSTSGSSFSPIISTLSPVSQLVFAILQNFTSNTPSSTIGSFGLTSPVQSIISGATTSSVLAQATAAVNLLNVLTIVAKLHALITVNPSLGTTILAHASANSQALNTFFNGVPASVQAALDVRTIANLSQILSASGLPNIPALLDFASIINLSTVFNQALCQVLQGVLPTVGNLVSSLLPTINNLLINVSNLLDSIIYTIIGLLGGVTATVNSLVGDIVYPTLSQVVSIVFPTLQQLLSNNIINQLTSSTSSLYAIPSQALAQASPIFQMLNSVA